MSQPIGIEQEPEDATVPFEVWLRRPTIPVNVAAEMLGISRASAFRAVHRGQLPSIRLGRRIVIPTAELRVLLRVHAAEDSPDPVIPLR
jgi:excisionase family DNA binding protein